MAWSVSRLYAKPTEGGGLQLDVSVTTPSGEAAMLSLTLSSVATGELRALLREILPPA